MKLKELRKKRNLTQKELASRSGVNFRSLQDYEQGHKKLTSSSGDVLLRLSTVLGCSMEDLLLDDFFPNTAPLSFPLAENETSGFFCEKFKTGGRWIRLDSSAAILFYYEGEQYTIPFNAILRQENICWLKEAAIMQMESKIEDILFSQAEMEDW